MDGEQFQFGALFDKLAQHKHEAIPLARAELARHLPESADENQKEALAKRQTNAAVTLLKFGAPDDVWPLFKFTPDPRVRSYVTHWVGPLGVDPLSFVQRLDVEPDVTARRALVLTLGQFSEAQLPASQRQTVIGKLLEVYEHEPDAGLHAAAEWLLRKWQQGPRIEALLEQLKSDEKHLPARTDGKRQWYVNSHKMTFMLVDARQDWFLMGAPESDPDHILDEAPHRVHIGRRLAVAACEVTKSEFDRFRKARPHVPDMSLKAYGKTDDSPQLAPSWYEAAEYCNWLSEQEGIPKAQWCY